MATWKNLLDSEREHVGDQSRIIAVAPAELDWDRNFDDGFGDEYGQPFCAWTERRVYFPISYDGKEWIGSVSRAPDGKPLRHFGSSSDIRHGAVRSTGRDLPPYSHFEIPMDKLAGYHLRRFLERSGIKQIDKELDRHKTTNSVYWIAAQMVASSQL
ncbi:hypothetical protein [uncultured Roseobacter sp.]|uniref:hypothetical protein n=1 Tax=uncultured Roseobacter sp. TaxID=114847 RepID=UPI00260BA177|nr:hypothetical protein [uncultured Roseobacter sp.]